MHILDPDTLTHLHAGRPNVIDNLKKLDDPDVTITIVTKIELLRSRFDFLLKASDGNQLLKARKLLVRTEELRNRSTAPQDGIRPPPGPYVLPLQWKIRRKNNREDPES